MVMNTVSSHIVLMVWWGQTISYKRRMEGTCDEGKVVGTVGGYHRGDKIDLSRRDAQDG